MMEDREPVALLALGTVLVQVLEGRWFGAGGLFISESWPRSRATCWSNPNSLNRPLSRYHTDPK